MIKKTKAIKTTEQSTHFTKKQIMKSEQFTSIEKDVLNSLLSENEGYTIKGVKELIKNFIEKEAI